jgi:hypothetical protein
MTRAALLSVLALVGVWASPTVEAQPSPPPPVRFLSVIDDIPLLLRLNEVGEPFDFVQPGSRVVESRAEGPDSALMVANAYRAALPGLGWREITTTPEPATSGASPVFVQRFARGNERLTLQFAPRSRGGATVSFRLVVGGRAR